MKRDAIFKTVVSDVARGDVEGPCGNIRRVRLRLRIVERGEDREAA